MHCLDTCCRPEEASYYAPALTTRRVSRCDRTCDVCGTPIMAGETYTRRFWPPYGGSGPVTQAMHANPYTCYAITGD